MDKPFAAYRGDEPYVFVSYAHEDTELVLPQLVWLHEQGVNVWYDEGISPGTRWSEELATALNDAYAILYFTTPRSVGSHHCLDEVNFALDARKPTIAVHLVETELTPGLRLRLSSHQAILKYRLTEDEYQRRLRNTLMSISDDDRSTVATSAPTTVTSAATIPAPPAASTGGRGQAFIQESGSPGNGKAKALGTLAAVVAITLIVAWWFYTPQTPAPDTMSESPAASEPVSPARNDSRPTIAVLPFDNFSPSEDNAYFAAGIHDDLLSALSKVKGLQVISRTSVTRFAGTDLSVPDIAAELGATNILEGSVRRAGNQVRIIVQLIDARNDLHLWSETYDRDLEDIFAVQSEVAKHITDELSVALDIEVLNDIGRSPTANMAAYDLYLRGKTRILERSVTGTQEGMALMQQALAADPDFALAHAWIAGVYVSMAWFGAEWQTIRDAAFKSAERAVALAPDLAEPNLFLGMAHFQDRNPGKAQHFLDRALELDPNNVTGLTMRSNVAMAQGEAQRAFDLRQQALALDPLDAFSNVTMAWSLQQMGQRAEANSRIDRAIELSPGTMTYNGASDFYWLSGNFDQALRYALLAHRSDPTNLTGLANIGLIFNWLGDQDTANHWLDKMQQIAPHHEFVYTQRIDGLVAREQLDEAGAVLKQWQAHDPENQRSKRYASLLLRYRSTAAYEDERYDEAARLNRQGFEIMQDNVTGLRVNDTLVPDVITSWRVLEYASMARRVGDEAAFNEAKQALVNLYASPGTLGWEDFQLAAVHALSGDKTLALEHLQNTPGTAFNSLWILRSLEKDPMGIIGNIGNDVAFQQVKDQLRTDNEATLARLHRDLPELFPQRP